MRVLGVTVFLLIGVSSFAQNPMTEAERLPFADGLRSRGMNELALKEYESFLKDFPESKKADAASFQVGECLRDMGKFDAADLAFEKVIKDYPQSALRITAGVRRADIAAAKADYGRAVELYAAVQKENPPDDVAATCYYFSGEAQMKRGQFAEAAKAFEMVKSKYATTAIYPYALLKLAGVYETDSARADEVLVLYKTVIAKPGSDRVAAEALFQMAELYFKRKNFSKSAEFYKDLMATYPKDARSQEAKLPSAWAHHNAGLYSDALSLALDMLKGDTGDKKAEWLYLQANCERQLLKNSDAVRTYDRLLVDRPESPLANASRYEKTLTLFKMGKYKEAIDEAKLMKPTPDLTKDMYWLLAECHAALKDEDNAVQYYRLIIKEFPESTVACDAMYRLASHLQKKGEFKEASRLFSTTAVTYPDNKLAPMALFASAVCLCKANMFEEAVRDWATLVQKYPGDALAEEAYYQRGIAETRLKHDAVAMAAFRDLIQKFPKSKFTADAHYWLGMLQKEGGKTKEAEEELRLGLQSTPAKEIEREIQFQLALLLQKNGKEDEAAGLFQALLASPLQDKFSPTLLQWMAEYKLAKEAPKEAMEAARLIVERNKDAAWQQIGLCLMGRASLALGEKDKAEEAFRKALEAKANTRFIGGAALQLGELTLAAGKLDEALKFFKLAAEKAPDENQLAVRARAYVGLAKASRGLGDQENAARYFMAVSILYEDPVLIPECLYEAATAFKKQGKDGEMREALKDLKKRYPDSEWAKKPDPQ